MIKFFLLVIIRIEQIHSMGEGLKIFTNKFINIVESKLSTNN